jgi:Flp pilus assembly protein TadG
MYVARRVARKNGTTMLARGQSLVEFALVIPIFVLILGGIIQFGVILWGMNSLNQVARDVGRWAATQQASPCSSITAATFATQADQIARTSTLIAYAPGEWSTANYVSHAENTSLPATPPATKGIETLWTGSPGTCPPADNGSAWFVTIRVSHVVPVFFPFIPGNGAISSTTEFRMEPTP